MKLSTLPAFLLYTLHLLLTETVYASISIHHVLMKSNKMNSLKSHNFPRLKNTWKSLWTSTNNLKMHTNSHEAFFKYVLVSKDIERENRNSFSNKENFEHFAKKRKKRSLSSDIQNNEKILEFKTNISGRGIPYLGHFEAHANESLNSKPAVTKNASTNLYFECKNFPTADSVNGTNCTGRENSNNTNMIFTVGDRKFQGFIIPVKIRDSTTNYIDSDGVLHLKPNHSGFFITDSRKNGTTLIDVGTPFFGGNTNKFDSDAWDARLSENPESYTDPILYNLTQNFKCIVDEVNFLNISCRNASLYLIGQYLPSNTAILDLSYSSERKLSSPLFPHLGNLTSLTLSNNHHKYITKAFTGLENLEILDLSNNDIVVLLKAFAHIPKLKILNLSGNKIISLRTIAIAVSYLHNLQNLTLDHNTNIQYIRKDETKAFANCNINQLSLFNTTLQHIERGAFASLSQLKILEISVNYLNHEALANVTCGITSNLERLFVRHLLGIRKFPEEAFNCLTNTSIQFIYMSNNIINTIPKLPYLPKLLMFSVSNCEIGVVDPNAFEDAKNLEVLDFDNNELKEIPKAVLSAKKLRKLRINYQKISVIFRLESYAFQNLSHLEELYLSILRTNGLLLKNYFHGMKALKRAHFSDIQLKEIEDFAFQPLTSLEILDLNFNKISHINNLSFFGLTNLRHLYLASNSIKFASWFYPFQNSPFLSVIALQFNLIEEIPPKMFVNLKFLEILMMTGNKIVPWNQTLFHPNSRIELLGLSRNQIDYVTQVMVKDFRLVTETLDLSKNPFNCNKCLMIEFQTFLLNSNLSWRFPASDQNYFDYTCMQPSALSNKSIFEIEFTENACDLETEILSLMSILLICFFVLFLIMLSLLCYIFRWYIKYWIFSLKTNLIAKKKGIYREKVFLYDAFVVYNSADTPWIASYLIPILERHEPYYRLCIHERDFGVGKLIIENILEAIEYSRYVILVLTENFIKSDWCNFELHLTQHKLFREARDSLILIKIRDINKKLFTKNISYLEKTRRCFMWSDCQTRQVAFWDSLRKELGQPATYKKLENV